MKILHIGKFYPPHFGGIESYVRELVSGLAGSISFHVLVSNDRFAKVCDKTESVKIIRVPKLFSMFSTPISPSMPFTLGNLISSNRFDIIHHHYPNPMGDISIILNKLKGAKLVITYHSDIIRQKNIFRFYKPISDFILGKASKIIVTSPNYLESSENLARFRDKCTVIPLGVTPRTPAFNQKEIADSTARLKTRYNKFKVLFIGRLVSYKGIGFLIKAVKNLDVDLLIVGDGPLSRDLKRLTSELGIEDQVHFLGEVTDSELFSCLDACDVLCLPSIDRNEAFGLVILEAMAAKKPVITTELNTGTSFINQDNHTGFVVKPKNFDGISTAITKLMNDPKLRENFGRNAYSRVIANFTSDRMLQKTFELYKEVLGK